MYLLFKYSKVNTDDNLILLDYLLFKILVGYVIFSKNTSYIKPLHYVRVRA